MSIEYILYLINLMSNLDMALSFVTVFIFMGAGVSGIVTIISESIDGKSDRIIFNWFKNKIWFGCLLLAVTCFIPCKQTMYLMLGSSYMQNSHLPAKVSEALELKLDDMIVELKSKGNK